MNFGEQGFPVRQPSPVLWQRLTVGQELASPQPSFTVRGIPQGWGVLRIVASMRGDAAATNVTGLLRFNDDSGANYDYLFNASNGASNLAGQTSIQFARVAGSTAPADTFSTSVIWFPDYSLPVKNHDCIWQSHVKVGTTNTSMGYDPGSGWWRSNNPLTAITFLLGSGNFVAGSSFRFYLDP